MRIATADNATTLMQTGTSPLQRAAAFVLLFHAVLWAFLFVRWLTFGIFEWTPYPAELALAAWPPLLAYFVYGLMGVVDLTTGWALWRDVRWARLAGLARGVLALLAAAAYFVLTREFYGTAVVISLSGLLLVLLSRNVPWSLNYPAAFWLFLFFVAPMIIVFIVSLGERARLGTVVYPSVTLSNLGVLFNDYARFFSPIGGDYIYLRIFGRSLGIAVLNTVLCLLLSYPFAYWIARQPENRRNILVFLVMIPFWTNFLVRTYAWMLILRDSGLINNFWSITLHEQAVALADQSAFFSWLAERTSRKLPLLFNTRAVMIGLLYGYLPFMVLPLYASLERVDWSLLEAAADLGANTWRSTVRVLLPLTMPGIIAGSIIVFIPSLGAYVTPDLLGGARVALLGNLLQQQFMTVRDWPFGSAIGFIMMAIMLAATLIYFRVLARDEAF